MSEPVYVDQGAEFSDCTTPEVCGPSCPKGSPCQLYRYRLWRYWQQPGGTGLPACFLMLNPSTADDRQIDPTLRRCVGFARSWGCSGLEVVNLFALRSTDPKMLRSHPEPIGPRNNQAIIDAVRMSSPAVLGWGSHGSLLNRDRDVMRLLETNTRQGFYALSETKAGHPGHPLYLKSDLRPVAFDIGRDGRL